MLGSFKNIQYSPLCKGHMISAKWRVLCFTCHFEYISYGTLEQHDDFFVKSIFQQCFLLSTKRFEVVQFLTCTYFSLAQKPFISRTYCPGPSSFVTCFQLLMSTHPTIACICLDCFLVETVKGDYASSSTRLDFLTK